MPAAALRTADPEGYIERARGSMVAQLQAMLTLGARGALLDGALGQDAGLGPFQRAVQVGKAAHRTAYLRHRDPIE